MNSQRRMYFKKQIMKDLSQQENNIENKGITSVSIYPNTDTAKDTTVTVLDSSSYHGENDRVLLMKTIPFNEENITGLDEDPQLAVQEFESGDLHPTFNETLVGRKNNSTENNHDIETEKENREDTSVTLLGSSSYHEQNVRGISVAMSSFNEENCKNIDNEIQNTTGGPESGEIQPTITEIIAENEMDLMRKSLEEDTIDNAEGMDSIINLLDKNQGQSEKKKSKRSQINKSYIDLLSDEEDFVWDSSSWKETGDESSSTESNKPQKKKTKRNICSEDGKVGNSGLRKKKVNKRKLNKEARDKGQEYMRKNGCLVKNRSLKPNPCLDKTCGNNCNDISDEKRKSIFDHFWSLSSQRKKDWLVGMTSKSDVKRKRSKESFFRENTFNYFINDGEGRRKVCKKFLVKTLDVSLKYVTYTLSNAYLGSSKDEARGKLVPANKTPQTVKESAINFIKSLPALPSHYCRKDSTRLYLPTEFKNIKNLYRIYKEAQTSMGIDIVGEKVFREIFSKDFNIGFHIPKKDKCVKCLRFEGKDVNENPEMLIHLKEKEASKNRLAFHRELVKKNRSILCTSFDLQKVLNTPHGNSMLLFYSRKYTVYNLCFYESFTRTGFCYTWGETEGKRGGNEIATILQKYIANVDSRRSIKKLILYSDSCPGQNKNKMVLAAVHSALLQAHNIETIQMNYLLPGHTEMTVDSIHATIENSVRNTIIWAPSQWATVFQLARKEPGPYNVECLSHRDFKNFEDFSEKYFKGNLSGKISKVRVATFKKSSPNLITIKTSMMEDAEDETVAIISRPKHVHQKYKTVLPLTTTKFNDLKKLCDTGVIPTVFHSEYSNFTHRSGKDVLVDTDIEDGMETLSAIPENRIERTESKRWRGSVRRVMSAAIYNLSCFTHGCSTGWVSGVLGNEALTGGAWLAALPCLVALPAAPFFAVLADARGRKAGAFCICVSFIISWSLAAWCGPRGVWAARVAAGAGGAGALALAPLYCAEIAPRTRGLAAMPALACSCGILFAYTAGGVLSAHALSLSMAVAPAILLVSLIWLPETPSFLISIGRIQDAAKIICWFDGSDFREDLTDVIEQQEVRIRTSDCYGRREPIRRQDSDTFQPMLKRISGLDSNSEKKNEQSACRELFRHRRSRRALFSCLVVLSAAAGSGAGAVNSFAAAVLRHSTHTVPHLNVTAYNYTMYNGTAPRPLFEPSEAGSILCGTALVLGAAVATVSVDKLGRKMLLLWSCSGITCCLAILGAYCDPSLRLHTWYSNRLWPQRRPQNLKEKGLQLTDNFTDINNLNLEWKNYTNDMITRYRINLENETVSVEWKDQNMTNKIQNRGEDTNENLWAPVALMSVVLFLYNIGLGSVPYVLISELFTINVRSLASSLLISWMWLSSFFLLRYYGTLAVSIGLHGTYYICASITLMGSLYIFFVIPETKGKSQEQIHEDLDGPLLVHGKRRKNREQR